MKLKIIITLLILIIGSYSFAQQKTTWDKWEYLIGEWKGEGNGEPGKGGGTFTFKADLDNHILVRRSHSEYPAANGRPATLHDDLMIIYLDVNNAPSKAIYFDNEGHIIHYRIIYSDDAIALISDKSASAPSFRLTYTMPDDNTVNTKFEMSQDGERFMTYIEGKSFRVK